MLGSIVLPLFIIVASPTECAVDDWGTTVETPSGELATLDYCLDEMFDGSIAPYLPARKAPSGR
jgi:hypothetical protein